MGKEHASRRSILHAAPGCGSRAWCRSKRCGPRTRSGWRPQPVVAGIGGRADGAVDPMVGTPTLVPEPNTVILRGVPAFRLSGAAVLAASSETWTKRNRSSVTEFSRSRCSSRVRLPLVFSSRTAMRSMVWRARRRSGRRFTLAEMHQAKLNFGLRAQGKNQETKGRGRQRDLEILRFLFGGVYVAHQLTFYNARSLIPAPASPPSRWPPAYATESAGNSCRVVNDARRLPGCGRFLRRGRCSSR